MFMVQLPKALPSKTTVADEYGMLPQVAPPELFDQALGKFQL
jgi:hypothetical protein